MFTKNDLSIIENSLKWLRCDRANGKNRMLDVEDEEIRGIIVKIVDIKEIVDNLCKVNESCRVALEFEGEMEDIKRFSEAIDVDFEKLRQKCRNLY